MRFCMKNEKVIILLAEGQTEKIIFQAVKKVGRFQFFNIWQQQISKLFPKFGCSEVQIFVDTDKSNNSIELRRFTENVEYLSKSKLKVKFYFQVNNLEDELAYACNNCIYKEFSLIKGSSELKEKLIKCTNLPQKLSNAEFDIEKLWTQKHDKCENVLLLFGFKKE